MYAIRITRQYFGPRVEKSYVVDERGDREEFRNRAAAEALAKQLDETVYHTSHNESGRPEYKVVRVK